MVLDPSKLAELYFGKSDPSVAAADVPGYTIRTEKQSEEPLEYPMIFLLVL
jgi:hypothetical protein